MGIEHGLSGCESLGIDKQQSFLDIESFSGTGEINWVDICQKSEFPVDAAFLAHWVASECLIDELYGEIATSDADDY